MAIAAVLAPHDVQTSLNYLDIAALGQSRPYYYVNEPPTGVPKTNLQEEPHSATVHDVRGKEDTVGLDITGFQFIHSPSVEKDFTDEDKVKDGYYKEVEELLKKETGAKRVFIFDHTIRRTDEQDTREAALKRGPVQRVHVDQTTEASIARVRYHLPEDANRLLKSRVRIINVWRPIANPVAHSPLAVADYRSLNASKDLIPTAHIYPDREGATLSVRHSPEHRWYYLSGQTPEEVTLIKCFDSREDVARLTPHTAFLDSTSPANAPQRQSIEVRALVFDAE